MKRKGFVLFTFFLLLAVFTNAIFAQQRQSARGDIYIGNYQIMNTDKVEIWKEGRFETEGRHFSVDSAKNEIRSDLGWAPNADYRKINGVNYKIIWTNVRRK